MDSTVSYADTHLVLQYFFNDPPVFWNLLILSPRILVARCDFLKNLTILLHIEIKFLENLCFNMSPDTKLKQCAMQRRFNIYGCLVVIILLASFTLAAPSVTIAANF